MKWAAGLRVLIVHDEPEFAAALEEAFAEMGFEVETALDGADAVARILARVPALVCVNLNLPNGSGYDVCELIRGDAGLERVKILVMSDRHTPEEIAYAEEAGADGFLRLPFQLKLLPSYVDALFEGRDPSRSDLRRLRTSEYPPPA